jgi:hypothetical protein
MHRLFLTAAFALAACGGATALTHPGESSSCSVTLSGAVTGTFDCQPATTAWGSSNNTGAFGFSVSASATAPAINVAIGWTGEPTTRHYKNTDTDGQGGITVQTGSGATTQVWAGCANAASGGGCGTVAGSYDLNITGISNTIAASNGKVYSTDGTITATLQPLTGQSGTVTVTATF